MQLLSIESTIAAQTQSLGIRQILLADIISIDYIHSSTRRTYAIHIGHNRVLSNLAKIYTNDAKYSGHNNNLIFKLAIFHNICFKADILLEAKIKAIFTILKSLVFDYFYLNTSMSLALDYYQPNINISFIVINFNQIYYLIKIRLSMSWIKQDTKNKINEMKIGIRLIGFYRFLKSFQYIFTVISL